MTDDTVYVATREHNRKRVYHTDPECRALFREPRAIDRELLFDDARECLHCSGDAPSPSGGTKSYYQALLRAAEAEE